MLDMHWKVKDQRLHRQRRPHANSFGAIGTALAVGATLSAGCWNGSAIAQAYPTKPIRLIVPFAPNGPTDVMSRVVGKRLSEGLGQQVVIDSRGGGGSITTDAADRGAHFAEERV